MAGREIYLRPHASFLGREWDPIGVVIAASHKRRCASLLPWVCEAKTIRQTNSEGGSFSRSALDSGQSGEVSASWWFEWSVVGFLKSRGLPEENTMGCDGIWDAMCFLATLVDQVKATSPCRGPCVCPTFLLKGWDSSIEVLQIFIPWPKQAGLQQKVPKRYRGRGCKRFKIFCRLFWGSSPSKRYEKIFGDPQSAKTLTTKWSHVAILHLPC